MAMKTGERRVLVTDFFELRSGMIAYLSHLDECGCVDVRVLLLRPVRTMLEGYAGDHFAFTIEPNGCDHTPPGGVSLLCDLDVDERRVFRVVDGLAELDELERRVRRPRHMKHMEP